MFKVTLANSRRQASCSVSSKIGKPGFLQGFLLFVAEFCLHPQSYLRHHAVTIAKSCPHSDHHRTSTLSRQTNQVLYIFFPSPLLTALTSLTGTILLFLIKKNWGLKETETLGRDKKPCRSLVSSGNFSPISSFSFSLFLLCTVNFFHHLSVLAFTAKKLTCLYWWKMVTCDINLF